MLGKILQGDCLEILPTLPYGLVDTVFIDPPYNIGIDYGKGRKADLLPPSKFDWWLRQVCRQLKRVLKSAGTLWVLIGEKHTDKLGVNLESLGFHRRRLIVWHETFGNHQNSNFPLCSRFLHYCVKDKNNYTFHPPRVPSARQTQYRDKRACPAGKVPESVWCIPRVCGTFKERIPDYPTQLPEALVERALVTSTNPGDLVLDCFGGSLTTARVAKRLGRNYISIDLNPPTPAALKALER